MKLKSLTLNQVHRHSSAITDLTITLMQDKKFCITAYPLGEAATFSLRSGAVMRGQDVWIHAAAEDEALPLFERLADWISKKLVKGGFSVMTEDTRKKVVRAAAEAIDEVISEQQ